MAAMASPGPDASVLDPKPAGTVLDKEHKSEMNGHAPPPASVLATDKPIDLPVESKLESPAELKDDLETTDKPLLNGNGNENGHAGSNGVIADDVDMTGADPTSTLESSLPIPAKEVTSTKPATETSPTDAAAETTAQDSSADPKQSRGDPTTAEDVEMADAITNDNAEPTTVSSESAVSASALDATTGQLAAKEPSPAEPAEDTEMAEKPQESAGIHKSEVDDSIPPSEDPLPTSEVDLGPASLSQLAIENEVGAQAVAASAEVSMADAPGTKVAREREDDAADEPAPKRAKTEPKEEESLAASTTAAAPATTAPSALDPATLSTLPQWHDEEKSVKEITDYQRREMRRVIGRIKKTKNGNHFRDSVQKLWPGIWDAYVAKITKPMDLSEIDRNLRDGQHKTLADFKDDLALVYLNTLAFNGSDHDITRAALGALRNTWEDIRRVPNEEPEKPKAVSKAKPVRESRNVVSTTADATTQRQSAGPAAAPVDVSENKPQAAAPQPANLRRASTATEGDRPKRTVRAPKPKDIDYSTKASRKKLKPELQFCEEVLSELKHPRNTMLNQWFLTAVDAEGLGIPHYYAIIKKPMDLEKVTNLLSNGDITSLKDFDKNVRLIFTNCFDFNGPPDQGNAVSAVAKQFETFYNSQMKGKDAWLSKHAKANARQASVSNASDDEEEDADDEGDLGGSGVDPSDSVKELESKYREEAQKLNALIMADHPIEHMIDTQQGILKVVQEGLLKAKLSLSEYRSTKDKGGKKGGGKKTKASGAAGRKAAGNAAPSKKAGGSKKAVKKSLTAADKDAIAGGMDDLQGSHLDRAIDIIKRDTGQNENTDGELELDIDQLSNEALLKLWELCKKALPGFGKDSAPAAAPKSSPEVVRTSTPKQPSNNAAKSKKNKPMSAQEQEARIAQLQSLRDLYKPGQEPADGMAMAMDQLDASDSSEESSSEEE